MPYTETRPLLYDGTPSWKITEIEEHIIIRDNTGKEISRVLNDGKNGVWKTSPVGIGIGEVVQILGKQRAEIISQSVFDQGFGNLFQGINANACAQNPIQIFWNDTNPKAKTQALKSAKENKLLVTPILSELCDFKEFTDHIQLAISNMPQTPQIPEWGSAVQRRAMNDLLEYLHPKFLLFKDVWWAEPTYDISGLDNYMIEKVWEMDIKNPYSEEVTDSHASIYLAERKYTEI